MNGWTFVVLQSNIFLGPDRGWPYYDKTGPCSESTADQWKLILQMSSLVSKKLSRPWVFCQLNNPTTVPMFLFFIVDPPIMYIILGTGPQMNGDDFALLFSLFLSSSVDINWITNILRVRHDVLRWLFSFGRVTNIKLSGPLWCDLSMSCRTRWRLMIRRGFE